ncbi:MAG: TolC family protein, partial [Alcaligenes aquatilis]
MAPQISDLSIKYRRAARRPHFALAALLLTLAGCTSMAPDYQQPAAPVPQAYSDLSAEQANAARARDLGWRQYFTDPILSKLIETALNHNRDMRVAVLRVDEARAMLNLQRSERFPEFTVGGQTARSRVPGDMNPSGQAVTGGDYRAQVGLTSWELDLWGRVRSLEDAALQGWLATEAGRQAAHVALVSQVA